MFIKSICKGVTAILFVVAIIVNCEHECEFEGTLSLPISTILCSVETGRWIIPSNASVIRNTGCMLGGDRRCSQILKVPTQEEVPKSPAPKEAKNKEYQKLATVAESIVPSTWWRQV